MKRLLLPLAIVALSSIASLSQTITASDLPEAGVGYLMGTTNVGLTNITPGPKGDQDWDFSGLSQVRYDTAKTLIPSETPYVSSFPTATHVSKITDSDGTTFTYYNMSDAQIVVIGIAYEPSDATLPKGVLKTQSALVYYTLPLTNGLKTYSKGIYSGKGPYASAGLPVDSVEITITLEKWDSVDASGIIKTPIGSSFDAIRLKTVAKRTITGRAKTGMFWQPIGASFGFPKIDQETSFNWWSKNIGNEVFRIKYEDPASSTPSSASWFITGNVGLENGTDKQLQVYVAPNPAENLITINGLPGTFNLRITDLQGGSVLFLNSVVENKPIDISSLTPGIYMLNVSTETGIAIKSKMIVK